MRIRLSVQRHRLPAVEVLWVVPDPESNPTSTIARMLTQVDEVIPLESEHWGLEDYVVQVDGFECLHFHKIGEVLKPGDHVTIRPLETPEVRARYLSGRTQISDAGQHLIDGVPFGRSLLRQAARPRISIPPRKRRRLSTGDPEVLDIDAQVDEGPLLLTNDDGESFDVLKNVHFSMSPEAIHLQDDEDDEEDEEDEDFDPEDLIEDASEVSEEDEEEHEDSDSDSDSESDSDSSDSSEVSSDSSSDSDAEAPLKKKLKSIPSTNVNGPTKTKKDSPGKKDVTEVSVNGTAEEVDANYNDGTKWVAPGQGKASTKSRNERRRIAKRLAILKTNGILPEDSTYDALRAFGSALFGVQFSESEANAASNPGASKSRSGNSSSAQSPGNSIVFAPTVIVAETPKLSTVTESTVGSADKPESKPKKSKSKSREQEAEFEKRCQKLVSSLQEGGIDIESLDPLEVQPSKLQTPHGRPNQSQTDETQEIARKRARLDISVTKRLVFGSLGVRTPKTKAEEEKLQKKLMGRSTNKPATPQVPLARTIVADEGPESDAWKGKIRLSAVECVQQGVVLSTPPYPFVQRWDPQQQRTPNAWSSTKARKRKRAAKKQYGFEELDASYNDNINPFSDVEKSTILDYDDAKTLGGSVDADAQSESPTKAGAVDDLPPLPANIEELPNISASDVSIGAIIAFKQLQLSEATNWQPTMSGYRTARVANIYEPDVFGFQLAERDRERREIRYDHNGNRILSKFEMATNEDSDQDDECLTLAYGELITPKLVSAGKTERNSPPAESGTNSFSEIDVEDIPGLVQGILENENAVMGHSNGVAADDDEINHVLSSLSTTVGATV